MRSKKPVRGNCLIGCQRYMLPFFRVDDRLVHGQVVEGWVPAMDIRDIIVVSDEIACDPLRCRLMRFAAPCGINLNIVSPEKAASILAGADKNSRIMVLMPGLCEAVALLRAGVRMPSLNIGGIIYTACRNPGSGGKSVLRDEDRKLLAGISGRGVRLDVRGVPSDIPLDMSGISDT